MRTAYLSLGSNLGDREANIENAIARLAAQGVATLRRSSIYETEPMDLKSQPWFLNLVIEVETKLFPRQLLARIHRIEAAMGRKRLVPKGPRLIDIDILLFGCFIVDTPGLTIPHPRLPERRFVLEPLAELASDLRHPVTRHSIREMLVSTVGQHVRRVL